jgi:glycosyltransferase involved in cell wall biosynthesis
MAQFLPQTIESIFSQDYPNLEYIVADGGSTDGTLDLLRGYGDRLRWFSEPDRGPSDAAWKGFRQATGDIFIWLNADDTFLPGAIHTAVAYLQAHPEIDIVYGEGWWIDEQGAVISRYPTLPFDASVLERDCFICQPTSFMRASAYRRCELDPAVNGSFDYDLWIRMAKAGLRFAAVPQYLANSRMHRGGYSLRERADVFRASMGLLQRHYGYIPLNWILGFTAFRLDGRDQFFEPLRPTLWKYLASLPVGLWKNPRKPLKFLGEWLATPVRAALRRV